MEVLYELLVEVSQMNTFTTNFYVWLTAHPNRMIVFFYYQLDAQILYFNTFIILLYMFPALLWSSSGGEIVVVQHLVPSISLGDLSVHRLRVLS